VSFGHSSLGANWDGHGVRFEVWAPDARRVEVVLESPEAQRAVLEMQRDASGYFAAVAPNAAPGARYRYRVDGAGPYPDPASRFQPLGVHGPSEVVDPFSFRWSDSAWQGLALTETVLYELHVGTFTPEGTFRAAVERLPYLRDLGVTAVELMPIADFPGDRNWGYDGVALFAPARCYGSPDELRMFIDAAHAIGLAVHLDVVYNHFGPDGAYQGVFSKSYVSRNHRSPWGDTLNFDDAHSKPVRDFVTENAVRWVREYHIDGLRLDATHAIVDDSRPHIVAEIAAAVRATAEEASRRVLVVVEDARNLRHVIDHAPNESWHADGVWADDFHHQMRRSLAGDSDGYFADFSGSMPDVAAAARQGWFFTGQQSQYFDRARGTDPSGLPLERFVVFLQNHDQIGNRAFGDRLHHTIDLALWRAASLLLLVLPETPLLFMGQEWAASAPFRFFTDHNAELGKAVTEGRREEFKRFAAFSDPERRLTIPDPQDPATFLACKLDWTELEREPFASMANLYRRLLQLRREEPALKNGEHSGYAQVYAGDERSILVRRDANGGRSLLAVVSFAGPSDNDISVHSAAQLPGAEAWQLLMHTEDPRFTADRADAPVYHEGRLSFARPGAVVLASTGERR
jgi:maltooligosyltrehalose trehalohydrolase